MYEKVTKAESVHTVSHPTHPRHVLVQGRLLASLQGTAFEPKQLGQLVLVLGVGHRPLLQERTELVEEFLPSVREGE